MIKTQIDQYDMLLAVENHFDDHLTLWNTNAPITATKTLISSKIDALAEQVALQLLNPTGVTIDKNNARINLENQVFTLSSALSGYANISNKMELYQKVRYTKSDLVHFRDAELLGVATNLHRDATTELGNLAAYGVNASVLANFLTAINTFGTVMKNPTEAIAKRKSATEKIAIMLPEIIELLTNRMDHLVVMLQATQSAFVSTYNNVRALNSTAVNPLSLTITCLNKATNEPIPNVQLEIVGEGINRISSERGYNTIQNLVSGSHQISATHPNFKTQTLTFSIVSGETTELVIELENQAGN